MTQKTETKNGKEKPKLTDEVRELKDRVARLEQFLQQQSLLLEQTISRLNRMDQMQIQMDVMLRNHQHGRGENGV